VEIDDFAARIPQYQARIDAALDSWLPPADAEPRSLPRAMRYSVLGPGKRMRPLFVYATGEVLGIEPEQIDPIAVAVELIHAYSLVHDDLPAMDDDDLRRGRPTTHIEFDEATAILVGDALQVLAFEVLGTDPAYDDAPDLRCRLIADLAASTGSSGMVGGQAIDIATKREWATVEHLEKMYALKTGCLIRAAILMPCHCAVDLQPSSRAALEGFANAIGLAFQIKDDLLEIDEDTKTIGKSHGSDRKNEKTTFPSLLGRSEAYQRAEMLYADAIVKLEPLGDRSRPLRWLSDFVLKRNH
jgi:geranylgeranyl pyrophosphate synthase